MASSAEQRSWNMGDLTQQLGLPQETFLRLGPFRANCLWFNRQMLLTDGVDRSRNEILVELNRWCGGFALYRDDFRIGKTGGMDDDWLEWDSGALKAQGYALNRYQTVGSVSISSGKNPYLVDSANRERLVSCPEQLLLKALLGDVLVNDLRSHINTVKEAEVKMAIAKDSTTASLKASEDNLRKTIRNIEEIGKILSERAKTQDRRNSRGSARPGRIREDHSELIRDRAREAHRAA